MVEGGRVGIRVSVDGGEVEVAGVSDGESVTSIVAEGTIRICRQS